MAIKPHFGNPMIEQRTLSTGKGIVELAKSVIQVSGPDRLKWLHSMLTSDVQNLSPGQSREALLLDPQGHVEHEFHIVDDGEITWLIVAQDASGELATYLDRMTFRSKVQVEDKTGDFSVFGAHAQLQSVGVIWQDPWPEVVSGGARYAKGAAASWSYFEYIVPTDNAGEFAPELERVGTDAHEALRIEAHRPSISDVDERTLPNELDWLATAVHLSKGCYRGQEAVAKTHNLGHPPRRFTFLHLDGTGHDIPAAGDPVFLLEANGPGEKQVGHITSVAQHFEAGPIALALLKRTVDSEADLIVVGENGQYSAKQEVIVPIDAGKAAGLKRPSLLMGK
jgi:hypothetical protein